MLHGGTILFTSAPSSSLEWRQPLLTPVRVPLKNPSIRSAFIPAIPEQPPLSQPPLSQPGIGREANLAGANQNSNGIAGIRDKIWRVYAKEKWRKRNETALSKHEPLPLPMTYPDSTPVPEDVEEMKNCKPEEKDCKDVLYQWTGKCTRCQGTGEVSYYRKRGREVICKCIACLGLGYVQKMTTRNNIDVMEDLDGKP